MTPARDEEESSMASSRYGNTHNNMNSHLAHAQ